MNTRNFGLLIADDNSKTRENYQKYLTEHTSLKDIWVYDEQKKSKKNVSQAEDAYSALQAIEKFIEETSYPMVVLADAYMPPNCDGNDVTNKDKFFGGLKLIDEINKNKKLKERVTVILITFYDDDELIQIYRNELFPNFNWKENIDYYFVPKIFSRDDGLENEEASHKELSEADNELRQKVFAKTFEIILKITDENAQIREEDNSASQLNEIIGESYAIVKLKKRIKKVAPTNRSILLLGETGTGKNVFANTIHSLSNYSEKEVFYRNCSTIPENLADTHLFGAIEGAYNGAKDLPGWFHAANGTTIFLDEIGNIEKYVQEKLLAVIETGKFNKVQAVNTETFNGRVIAATNKNVDDPDRFCEDLRTRFKEVITIPPLRERREDIPILVEYFQKKYNSEHGNEVESFDEVMPTFKSLNWPRNVRQLRDAVDNLIFYVEKGKIKQKDLEAFVPEIFKDQNSTNISPHIGDEVSAEVLKNAHIIKYLKSNDWNIEKSYKILGYGDSKLYDFKKAFFELEQNNWDIERTSEVLGKKFIETRLPKNGLENIKKAHFKLNPSL